MQNDKGYTLTAIMLQAERLHFSRAPVGQAFYRAPVKKSKLVKISERDFQKNLSSI